MAPLAVQGLESSEEFEPETWFDDVALNARGWQGDPFHPQLPNSEHPDHESTDDPPF